MSMTSQELYKTPFSAAYWRTAGKDFRRPRNLAFSALMIAACMALALADAGLEPEAVDYINAHGTSTPLNDACETAAIHTVFKDHVQRLMVSSTKSMTGHLLGAAGAVEAIFTALALEEGLVPATIGYQVPDPACDLDIVPNQGRRSEIKIALSNSLGFGGHNAAIALKKWEG